MFDKVVIPLDGSDTSERILPYATALARGINVPVSLLFVIDPTSQSIPREDAHPIFLAQLLDRQRGWANVYLREVAAGLRAAGVDAEVQIEAGRPAEQIIRAARSNGNELVAMATHGRSGMGRLLLGSVADEVLQDGAMPLLLYKPGKQLPARFVAFRTIIVPLDGSALSEQVLPLAQYLARIMKARVLLTRVLPIYAYTLVDTPLSGQAAYELLTRDEEQVSGYLHGIEAMLDGAGLEAGTALVEGEPASELSKLAAGIPNSLILMATHGRSGIGRTLLGSVADEVIRKGGSPVLLHRVLAHESVREDYPKG